MVPMRDILCNIVSCFIMGRQPAYTTPIIRSFRTLANAKNLHFFYFYKVICKATSLRFNVYQLRPTCSLMLSEYKLRKKLIMIFDFLRHLNWKIVA